ncbi:MAG: ribosomal RNA small subunit methyltransferase A [Ignavibacteriae bacterium]|nr:MAG: ribosomal RNA small subunit methyltransferase A [Ignavibacteriota bacterium]
MAIKSLKKFGQNYLIDRNIVQKMVRTLALKKSDSVLEIGPGKGFITKELVKAADSVTAVEIDTRVIEQLNKNFDNLIIHNKNITKINLEDLKLRPPIKVIGNIPFNITGDILFKLIENKKIISDAVLIVSLDIAKRITANYRTKEYGSLTVIMNYFATSKIIQKVSRNVFYPKPNIDSAILHLKFNKEEIKEIDNQFFIKVIKASFGNRRKTLNNSLRNSIFGHHDFNNSEISLSKRAEELELNDFLKLTRFIQELECKKQMK